jgi:alpha-D-ribose 1-methylphosphonate 5-triphosphate diphosphatase
MRETRIFSNYVVTSDAVVSAEILVRDGVIEAIEPRTSASAGADDWGDDYIIPGLVDIHTDNLEKHYQPRPGATWDSVGAVMAHDAQCISAGITTVFDSLCLHGERNGLNRAEAFPVLIDAIESAANQGFLKAEHILHIRCEVTNPALMDGLEPQLDNLRVKMLSMMDHRPGQRQLRSRTVNEAVDAEAESLAELCASHRAKIAGISAHYGFTLAAHDDATVEQVQEAGALGCTMAEFPVTIEAAQEARASEMVIAMGAPNLVRGGSHSGNLSAGAAAKADLLDIITSDYIPFSMLRAAFLLTEEPYGWSLPRAIATVTDAPAKATALTDRGRVAKGFKADLVRVAWQAGKWPRPVSVWRGGERVA